MSAPSAPPIRSLAAADTADAIALWQACGLTRPWNDAPADIAEALAGPASTILAVRDGAALIGTVMVGHDGHRGWLYYLAVSPAAQGQGIGRALVEAAEAWLRARGAPKVQLMIRADNDAATGFYAALGYEPSDVIVVGKRLDGDDAGGC